MGFREINLLVMKLTGRQIILLALILFLALTLRLHAALTDHTLPEEDALAYDWLAMNLLEGKGYRDAEGNLTAYRPPLYPVFLAVIYRLTGHDYQNARIAQAILSTLTVLFIGLWAGVLFGGASACWAALVAALYPAFYAYTYRCSALLTETLYIFLLTGSLYGLYRYFVSPHWLAAIASGIALGLAILTRPVPLLLIFYLPLVLLILRFPPPHVFKYHTFLWLMVALILLPWTLRNYFVFKAFVPVATLGGENFYLANHPGSDGMGGSQGESAPFYEGVFRPQDDKLNSSGKSETEKSKYFFGKGFEFIRRHPGEALKLFLWKAPLYMDPRSILERGTERKRIIAWPYLFVLGSALASYVLARNVPEVKRSLLSLFFIFGYFLICHIFLVAGDRYRFPSEPILIVAASFAMSQFSRKWIGEKGLHD